MFLKGTRLTFLKHSLNMKSNIKQGDKVRVSGGPYYLTKDGRKIKLGESGIGTFVEMHIDGKGALVSFDSKSVSYVYVGPECVAPLTGTVLRPHKISKKRKRQ